MKILHILSGTYCLLAPLGSYDYVLDFDDATKDSWANEQREITSEFWDSLWDTPNHLEIAAHLVDNTVSIHSWENSYLTLKNYMCKNEFELVD